MFEICACVVCDGVSMTFILYCCVSILIYVVCRGDFLNTYQEVFKYWNLKLVCYCSLFKVCFGGLSYTLTNRSFWNSTSPSRKTLLLECMDAKACHRHTHRLVAHTHACVCAGDYLVFSSLSPERNLISSDRSLRRSALGSPPIRWPARGWPQRLRSFPPRGPSTSTWETPS